MGIKRADSSSVKKTSVVKNEKLKLKRSENKVQSTTISESKDVDSVLVINETSNSGTTTGNVTTLTKDNFESEVRNQKGTTFVIIGGPKCGRCENFEPIVEKVSAQLGSSAKFTSYTLLTDEDDKIYRQLKSEAKNHDSTVGYPIVVKCVDGTATEFYSFKDYSRTYRSETSMLSWFESKIEKKNEAETPKAEASKPSEEVTKAEEKTSTKEIVKLTNENFNETTQKGTTFIVVCGEGCKRCEKFDSVEAELNEKFGNDVTFADMTLTSDTNTDEYKLYKQLKNEAGVTGKCGYPIIIKCVDGKVEGFYDYSQISDIYTDSDKMSDWIEEKIDGTNTDDKDVKSDTTEDDCADGSCNTPDDADESKKNKYIHTSDKLSESDIKNAKNSLILQVQSAQSIGALKNILLEVVNTSLDINTQLALMDTLNEIKRTDELSSAKAKVLNKINSI